MPHQKAAQPLRFVALDFETANHDPASACELGMARCEGELITDERCLRIRPPSGEFFFTYLHGISWEDVRNAPCFAEHWTDIRTFLADVDFLVAHNAPFDRGVLTACCRHHRLDPIGLPFLCTVEIARRTWNIYPTKLPDVCRKLSIPLGRHHRGADDARACARIALRALAEMGEPDFRDAYLAQRGRRRAGAGGRGAAPA